MGASRHNCSLYRTTTVSVGPSSEAQSYEILDRVNNVSGSLDNNGRVQDAENMDKASHLSVVLDLSPTQWHLAAQSRTSHSLTLSTFLSHLLSFLNAHIACKDENSLAVFGALPGKWCVVAFAAVCIV